MKGVYIVFEGIDGCGKDTQIALLRAKLIEAGIHPVVTREPSDNPIGWTIRTLLRSRDAPDARTLALLYAADRWEHMRRVVRPALEEGRVVLSSRSFLSSLAYQGELGIPEEFLLYINAEITMPDIAIVLDVPADVAMERLGQRGDERTVLERKELLERVRRRYKELQKKFDFVVVLDGTGTPEEVFQRVWGVVGPLIRARFSIPV